jgi:hypothetical protein
MVKDGNITSPLNPLSTLERGLENRTKYGFLPLLHLGEGGRGMRFEPQKLSITHMVIYNNQPSN